MGPDGDYMPRQGEIEGWKHRALHAERLGDEYTEKLDRAEAVIEAARVIHDSPAGRRYGFLPLANALEAWDALNEKGVIQADKPFPDEDVIPGYGSSIDTPN